MTVSIEKRGISRVKGGLCASRVKGGLCASRVKGACVRVVLKGRAWQRDCESC